MGHSGHCRSHDTDVLLSVETVIVLKIDGEEVEVQEGTDLGRDEVGTVV